MRSGVLIHPHGDLADAKWIVDVAVAAERGGWDGVFLGDEASSKIPNLEPWTILPAIAVRTRRIVIGAAVTPLPRRPAHLVAHAAATLDRLSGGRVVFVAGIGGNREMHALGVSRDSRVRSQATDTALDVITRLWSGELVTVDEAGVTLNAAGVDPGPVQQPRIPVWVGGWTRDARRRAARWDGWVLPNLSDKGRAFFEPRQFADFVDELESFRKSDSPPDVAVTGTSAPDDGRAAAFVAAGATWWLESLFPLRGDPRDLRDRIEAGPPK